MIPVVIAFNVLRALGIDWLNACPAADCHQGIADIDAQMPKEFRPDIRFRISSRDCCMTFLDAEIDDGMSFLRSELCIDAWHTGLSWGRLHVITYRDLAHCSAVVSGQYIVIGSRNLKFQASSLAVYIS